MVFALNQSNPTGIGLKWVFLQEQFNSLKSENDAVCFELQRLEKENANLKKDLESTKMSFKKYKDETVFALNNFAKYKIKMEKNAELHQENILAYINVISKKDKIIETLSKHHVLCKINK